MAKQRGIHQISGTINNLTYYEQKYVRGGLIRRVNEGMSERLKTDPSFQNTRDKNAVFGMCSRIAAAVWQHFPELGRNCIRPSAHARTTRFIYQYVTKQGFQIGDTFSFTPEFARRFVRFLNSQLRRRLDEYLPEAFDYVDALPSTGDYNFSFSEDSLYKMGLKLNTGDLGVGIREDLCVKSPEFDATTRKYSAPDIIFETRHTVAIVSADSGGESVTFPISRSSTGLKFWTIWVAPVKSVSGAMIPDYSRAICWFVMYNTVE